MRSKGFPSDLSPEKLKIGSGQRLGNIITCLVIIASVSPANVMDRNIQDSYVLFY